MVLSGLRVIEGSAFVAAPLGGMTLAQLGADVIRFDVIGGGLDYGRWPLSASGMSLYWAGLNKGKRSIAVDIRHAEGRELVTQLITAPGPDAGILLSNFPEDGWLADGKLRERRHDLIYVNIIGNPDRSTAVDYTVNASSGFPYATGPSGNVNPINHALPAWDIAAGLHAAVGLLSAERYRSRTGDGQYLSVSLADVTFAMVANLGYLAQAQLLRENRPPLGNDMYGAFGRDFPTADGRRVMVVAISERQWESLVRSTQIEEHLPAIEKALNVNLSEEGGRFAARDAVAALIAPWIAQRTTAEVSEVFDRLGVCWGPYQTFTQLVDEDWRCSAVNPLFKDIEQPGIGLIRTAGSPVISPVRGHEDVRVAPLLGQHTDEILDSVLGMAPGEIGRLHDKRIVAGTQ